MPGLISKLQTAARARKSYTVGLIQAKAYRILKERTRGALAPLGVSTLHFALLGILESEKAGIRMKGAAEELGVEAPLITTLSNKLRKKGYIEVVPDTKDARIKYLHLTAKGREFLNNTEQKVRARMQPLIHNIPLRDLLSYLVVLEKIIENEKHLQD